MRVMGIDFGVKRVGVAISDPTGTLASPLTTLTRRRGKRPPLKRLSELATERGVERIVMGLPITLEGEEDDWCREVRGVGDALASRTTLPVLYVDERFSSTVANRAIRTSGLSKSDREDKARVDAGAAAVILQAYLDGVPTR